MGGRGLGIRPKYFETSFADYCRLNALGNSKDSL